MNQIRFTQISHNIIYDSENNAIYEKLLGLDSTGQIWKYNFQLNVYEQLTQTYIDNTPVNLRDIELENNNLQEDKNTIQQDSQSTPIKVRILKSENDQSSTIIGNSP